MQVTCTDLNGFIACCSGRASDYALQQSDGRYLRQGRPLTYEAFYAHLVGRVTLGTYVISEWNTCTFAVFDHDSDNPDFGLATLLHVQASLMQDGIVSHLERSRRGGHLWVFCTPVHPMVLRAWLLPYCPVGVEFYPKQDTLGKGCLFGSAVRVPLGIHRLTGERYPFVTSVNGALVPCFSSISEALPWFVAIDQMRNPIPETVLRPFNGADSQPDPQHETYPSKVGSGEVSPSMLSSIADWCRGQDPFAVIGRYVELDHSGLGCCPFGSHHSDGVDSHPSFRVYAPATPDLMCWYCHTWGRGGSLFDFLKFYYGMSARDLWVALQQGAQF